MNEYNLPVWYIKYWDFLCRIQQFKEDKTGSLVTYSAVIAYLTALRDTETVTKEQAKNLMAIIQEFVE